MTSANQVTDRHRLVASWLTIREAGGVSPDGIEPLRQPFAPALGEHLAEEADVAGEAVQFRAVDENGFESEVLRLGEALWPAEDPSSDDTG
ncbi:hypothetical protein [Streptomyces sp. NBC_01296]|uniref:hypothetical protein n=1 Tax=Streptomyces sp. NBC_01296 TaxID=2903816 RepID=UPI002E13D23F|nr:hypothetical protein OG299_38510 [Streptomyces sp. NBC_01296]